MKCFLLLLAVANRGVLAAVVSHSLRATSLQAPDTEQALKRLEAVEDQRSSLLLCRIAASEGQSSVTVRLQPSSNARSLVFNDDVDGIETKVRCNGKPDPQCLAASKGTVQNVEDCPQCPCNDRVDELFGSYAKAMAHEVDSGCGKTSDDLDKSRFRVLLLGLGGGELAAHIAKSCGGGDGSAVDIEAVELDGRLPVLGNRYFGLPESVKTTVGDALPVVSALEQQVAENQLLADQRRFDNILVDCFSTGGVTPEHCRSPEFIGKLHALLRNGGRVLHHMWHVDDKHPQVPTDFSNTIAIYQKIFTCSGCEVTVMPLEGGPDSLITASRPVAKTE